MGKFYQVSTLQALALGFSKPVVKVGASQDEIKSVEQGKGR